MNPGVERSTLQTSDLSGVHCDSRGGLWLPLVLWGTRGLEMMADGQGGPVPAPLARRMGVVTDAREVAVEVAADGNTGNHQVCAEIAIVVAISLN